jgi:hypothetical protein
MNIFISLLFSLELESLDHPLLYFCPPFKTK